MNRYYVHHNGYSWYVKEEQLFIQQGGKTEPWGLAWKAIDATSIEDARRRATELVSG